MRRKILLFMLVILAVMISFPISMMYFFYVPTIALLGESDMIINLGEEYHEYGATLDELLDLEKYIVTYGEVDTNTVGEYIIYYEADIPFLSNKTIVKRKVTIIDEEAPTLTLKGKDITIYVNGKYREPGYEASDEADGDLTSAVTIESNLNTKKVGVYEIYYNVKDSSGNLASACRKVTVKERPTTTKKTTINPNKDGDNSIPTTKTSKGGYLPILMYHYFYDPDAGETGKNSNYMSIKDFEIQMKYLSDNNYYFPSWTEVADFIDGKIKLPSKSIVITIDDGQTSFFKYAIPILNKYNIKATSFIITSKAGGTKFKNYQFDNINYESHTHAMHTGGCSGGHGGLFRCINYDKGLADLKTSISILGKNNVIAYPYGDVTNNVLKITKAAGFKIGLTTVNKKAQVGMDRYQLPRVRMSKGISLENFIKSI